MTTEIFINNNGPYGYEYTISTEIVNTAVRMGQKPDPEWFHIDNRGHFHAFNLNEGNCLPTLEEVEDVPEGGSWEHRCLLCEDIVSPHYLPGGIVKSVFEGPRSAGFTIPRYNRSVSHYERVSFYTKDMFGIARVVAFGIEKGFDGKSVSATFQCEFVVKRSNDL